MYEFAKKTDFFQRSEGLLQITYYGTATVSAKDSTCNRRDSYIANQAAKNGITNSRKLHRSTLLGLYLLSIYHFL